MNDWSFLGTCLDELGALGARSVWFSPLAETHGFLCWTDHEGSPERHSLRDPARRYRFPGGAPRVRTPALSQLIEQFGSEEEFAAELIRTDAALAAAGLRSVIVALCLGSSCHVTENSPERLGVLSLALHIGYTEIETEKVPETERN